MGKLSDVDETLIKTSVCTSKLLSRSQQKCLAIEAAAERVFIQFGYQKASMDKIASEAQVSKRTVYNHFSTKDELFRHILVLCLEDLFVSTDIGYEPNQPLADQLIRLLSNQWELYSSDRFVKLSRVVIAEYAATPKFLDGFIKDIEQEESGLDKWLKAAMADGRLKPVDLEYASELLGGAVKIFAHDPLLFDQPLPDKQQQAFILNEFVAMFLWRYQRVLQE
jgi:TetR/AcrR family transcriptional regulator of autoinduction and epiphytic fitness